MVKLVPVTELKPRRQPGGLKSLLEIPDAFFDPLPDEILEDFYGKEGLETVNRLVREEAERQAARKP